MRRVALLVYTLLFFLTILDAQPPSPNPPKREVRAVWITTASGLDWPHSFDREDQQRSLKQIIATLKQANFNTIFFQARARGDAYYRSAFEPWAENLTGVLGRDPGWDPLAFLIAEAHREGVEVHAWFNVYKIRGPKPPAPSNPPHPAKAYPAWTIQYDGETWFDPGIPGVNTYLLRVAMNLIRNYDLDGIHLDFIRYPGSDMPDAETYRLYGGGMPKEEWRRSNVNRFVDALYDSATAIKPMLKIGSAPLGLYDGDSNGNSRGSYFSHYQDSRGWAKTGHHDYLVPQIYWTIGARPGNPDFAGLTRQWKHNSGGRQIYAGIGAFKDDVKAEIPAQIDSVRMSSLDGQSFFRYENIKETAILGGRYRTPALIPSMPWKDSIPPLPPGNLVVTEISPKVFHLKWSASGRAADGDMAHSYVIYRWPESPVPFDNPKAIVAVAPSKELFYVDSVVVSRGPSHHYAVTAIDKGNNESVPSNTFDITVMEFLALQDRLTTTTSLSVSVGRQREDPIFVAYALAERSAVSLTLETESPDGTPSLVRTLVNATVDAGTHVVGLGDSPPRPGRYTVRLRTSLTTVEQPLEITGP